MLVDRLLRVALAGSAWVLYFLLALSVFSFATMFERWLFFRRHKDDFEALRKNVGKLLRAGKYTEAENVLTKSPSFEARVLTTSLGFSKGGPDAIRDAVESELGAQRKELEKGSNLLGTLGNNAPFIGLFGTVLGVIEAFHQLSGGANKAAMGNVMSGIAEALVATGVGLFVALPAVVAYNLVQKRIADIENDTWVLAKLFIAAQRVRANESNGDGDNSGNGGERDGELAEAAE